MAWRRGVPDAAGDLNNHVRWDKPGKASNHANAVIASAALGLVSAYHAFHLLEQGAERHPTLYWRDRTRTGPTFHIDYVFVPKSATSLLRRVSIGSHAKWIATGLSDHAPLIVDFLPEFASTTSRKVNKLRKARGARSSSERRSRRLGHHPTRAHENGLRRAYAIFNNCYQNFGMMNATTMAAILSKPERLAKEPECRDETRESSERSYRWLERWNMS